MSEGFLALIEGFSTLSLPVTPVLGPKTLIHMIFVGLIIVLRSVFHREHQIDCREMMIYFISNSFFKSFNLPQTHQETSHSV